MTLKEKISIDDLDFEKGNGLLPVVVQDFITRKVLMVAYVNKEALHKTLETGFAHYWSRSRGILWLKGETSGNYQKVVRIEVDCDNDTITYLVEPLGPACHTGNISCFFRELDGTEKIKKKYDTEIINEIITYFEKAKIVKRKRIKNNSRNFYELMVNPITKNIPPLSPKIIAWIADKINNITSNNIDKVVVPETLGLSIGSLVAQMKGKPLAIIRKRSFHTNDYLLDKVTYSSEYEKGTYYIYGINKGDRVLIIDDTISTGDTLMAIIETLLKHNVKIIDIACIVEKEMYNGKKLIEEHFGISIKTLIKIRKEDNKNPPYSITVKVE
jgi:phosphoribosyl-AMP cyclohydrolase